MHRTQVIALGVWAIFSSVLAAAEPGGSAGQDKASVSHPFVCADYGQSKVFVVSAEGKVTWEYPAQACQDAWRLPSGNILLSHVRGAVEVTPEKKVVWEYKGGSNVEIYTCQPLPDGKVLIGESGTRRLIEVDRQGKIAHEIPFTTPTTNTHMQIRMCRKTAAGTYLVAFTGDGVVRELDAEGKVVRTIKTPGCPYQAIRLPNGNTLIACGDMHQLIEVDANDRVVWQLNEKDVPGNPLRFVAGMQRLPNGNTVISNWGGHGFVGQQPQVFEVTRDKKLVWQVFDNQQFRLITTVHLLDVPGDPIQGEILR